MKKIISYVLVLSMIMAFAAITPLGVSAATDVVISDDFSDSSFDFTKWNSSSADNVTLMDGAAKVFGGWASGKGFGATLSEPISSGGVRLKFDIQLPAAINDTASTYEMQIYGGDSSADANALINISKTGINIGAAPKFFTTFAAETWYTVQMDFTAGSDQASASIVPTAGGTPVTTTATVPRAVGPHSQFYFGTKWMSANMYMLVDNVSVEKVIPTVHELPVTDDFGGASFDFDKWNASSAANVTLENGAAKVFGGWNVGKGFGVKLDNAVTTDSVKMKFDIQLPLAAASETTYELQIYGGDSSADGNAFINLNKSGINLGAASKFYNGFVPGEWYTIETQFDLATGNSTLSVVPTAGGTPVKTAVTTPRTAKEHIQFYFGTKWLSANMYFLIDNLSIESVIPAKHELPFTDDFNGSEFDFDKWNSSSEANVALLDGAAKVYGGWSTGKGFGMMLDEPITYGPVRLKFDLKLPAAASSENTYELQVYGKDSSADANAIMNINKSGINIGSAPKFFTGIVPETWYTVQLDFDAGSDQASASIVPAAGGVATTTTATVPRAVGPHSQFYFGTKWMTANMYMLIDNVSITRVYENPMISSLSFTKYDGTVSTSLAGVPAGAKQLDVKFNTLMDADSLQSSIKLTNTKTNTLVNYTGSYSDDTMTWTVPLPDYLAHSTTYRLEMTSDAKNGEGTAASPAQREFLTDGGEFKVSVSAWKGSTLIENLTQLSDGDTVTLKAQVVNTVEKDADLLLIYGAYSGDKLTAYKGEEKTISAAKRSIVFDDVTVTVATDGLTGISVFGWDSYDTLKPLTASYVIK